MTRAIELFLAATAELGGRFGKMTVVDALRGTRSKTIDQFDLHTYRRFGELHDIDRKELADIADALVTSGLLEVSATLKPTIRLTAAGERAVKKMTLQKFSPPRRQLQECDNPEALMRLRAERDRIAQRDGLAATSVCPDNLLIRLANELPASRREMMKVEGMSEAIYNACGTSLISVLESLAATQLPSGAPADLPDRLRRTYMLHESGCNLDDIARRSALQPSTVSGHLEELIKLGVQIDIERFVPSGIIRSVREELKRAPGATLRELRALIGGAIEYPELRIAAAWVRGKG
jgi:ATP-dependent DNA helicase RecQ